jgi:hypothetical protein
MLFDARLNQFFWNAPIAIFTFVNTPERFEDEPPLFIYPIVAILMFLISLGFFKGVSTQRKLTAGKMSSFSKSPFYDPLPYYHFFGLAAFIMGLCGVIRDLISNMAIGPLPLFCLTVAAAFYLSVIIANAKFIKEPRKLKKVL